MPNEQAPKGHVFVCIICNKRSRDKYGYKKIDRGWDVSCMLNSQLFTRKEAEKLRKSWYGG